MPEDIPRDTDGPPKEAGMEIFWFADGHAERRAPEDLKPLLGREEGFVWVDLPECDEAALALLTETFGFHPLAVRDCRERNHIAKLRAYPDHLFAILHAPEAGSEGQVHLRELDYFAGHRYLVTVHGPSSAEVPLESLLSETRAAARRIESGRFRPRTPAELSHGIVSGLAAHQEVFVGQVAKKVAALERHVVGAGSPNPEGSLEEMFRARHELLTVRTMAAACREVYARMIGIARFLPPEAMPFIEDLVDQFERVRALCDGEKEFLQGVVDFYQSRTTTKINIAMERLTLISAVVLPITAVTGIYGMNIIVNQQTQPLEVGLVLGTLIVIAIAMLSWAKRRGWW